MDETSWFKGRAMQMTAGVGKMELVQMPEGSTYMNESTQSSGDDECLPNVS